jgi:hypothetical protein
LDAGTLSSVDQLDRSIAVHRQLSRRPTPRPCAGGKDNRISRRNGPGDVVLSFQITEHRFGSRVSHFVCVIRIPNESTHLVTARLQ